MKTLKRIFRVLILLLLIILIGFGIFLFYFTQKDYQPVPVEGGFAADDEAVFAERCDGEKKRFGVFGVKVLVEWLFAGLIDDADVH